VFSSSHYQNPAGAVGAALFAEITDDEREELLEPR
jgi:hypothetical protein